MQNFVGKTKCIVGYMKVADGRKVMFSSPSVVTFKYYVLAYSES